MTSAAGLGLRKVISRRYQDPLDLVWLQAATAMGMRVERDPAVFASWDGCGTLRIGVPESLDPDDCLAQIILHEICHALVEGPASLKKADWGLEIDNSAHRVREHACLRLQAALAAQYGLRDFFAATTAFRRYYDALPEDPLANCDDPAVDAARDGWQRASAGSWAAPLHRALQATSDIAAAVRSAAPTDSLWATENQFIARQAGCH